MEKTQSSNMSAQLVPFVVLLAALFVVGVYVAGLDLRTDVKSAEQSQLPFEAVNRANGLTINYPDGWTVEETQEGGLIFTPDDRDEDDELLRINFQVLDQVLDEVTAASGDVEFVPFALRNTDRAAVAYKQEVPEETSPGRPERINYVIFIESGDERTIGGALSTNENDIGDYQELFEGMARSARIDESIVVAAEDTATGPDTFESSSGISFDNPDNLLVQEQQGVVLVQLSDNPQPIQIVPGTLQEFAAQLIQTQPEEYTVETVMQQLFAELPAAGLTVSEEPTEQTYGDLSGLRGVLTTVDQQTQQEIVIHVAMYQYQTSATHVLVIGQSAPESLSDDIAALEPILSSLSIAEPQAPEAEETPEEADEEPESSEEDTETGEDAEEIEPTEGAEDTEDSEETTDDTEQPEAEDTEDTEDAEEVGAAEAPETTDRAGQADTTEDEEEPAAMQVNFVDTITSDAGFSVGVPEGFTGAAEAEFIILNRGNDEIRVVVIPQEDLVGFLGNTLNLPVDELPSEDLALTLINELSGALPDAGDVVSENGTAYVDYSQFGEGHRVYMAELSNGNVLYADTAAFAQNEAEVATILMATIQTVELTEDTAAEEDTEATEDETEAAEEASEDTETEVTEEDDTETAEEEAETSDVTEEVIDVTFAGTHENEDEGFTVSVPEGYEADTEDGTTVLESGNSSIRIILISEEDLLDFINETFGLDIEELPNNDLAINLMNRFGDIQAPDVEVVSGVTVNEDGNRAYIDIENLGRKTRHLIEVLDDGRVLYAQADALGQDFPEVAGTLLAVVNAITFAE
ncbi:MAG: hypothetical protein L0154_26595 [Chloroflexi bacterium]|nr:hypothetical protein [Chloroflexota bacterium]